MTESDRTLIEALRIGDGHLEAADRLEELLVKLEELSQVTADINKAAIQVAMKLQDTLNENERLRGALESVMLGTLCERHPSDIAREALEKNG